MRELPSSKDCFVCGTQNPFSAQVIWQQVDDHVEGIYVGKNTHVGFSGIIHGGVVTALLDECIGWAISLQHGVISVTGELTIKFSKSLTPNSKVIVKGFASTSAPTSSSYNEGHGIIESESGELLAEASGKFFPVSVQKRGESLRSMTYRSRPNDSVTSDSPWGIKR